MIVRIVKRILQMTLFFARDADLKLVGSCRKQKIKK